MKKLGIALMLSMISILGAGFSAIVASTMATPSVCTIRVFIHGTILPGLGIPAYFDIINDTLHDTSRYAQSIARIRKAGFLERSDCVLGHGLVHITPLMEYMGTVAGLEQKAALHIVAAFDAINGKEHPSSLHEDYLFGWNGLLSAQHREQASEELFNALYNLKKEKEAQGHQVVFELYTHSHGAQLALHMPRVAAAHTIKDMTIDTLVMSGTPLYKETARNIDSGMFLNVINFYAPADSIQTFDRFSLRGDKSVRTFQELGMTSNDRIRIVDACLTFGHDTRVIGHPTFFILDRYGSSKDSREAVQKLAPLPLVVLYGPLGRALKAYPQKYRHVSVSLECRDDNLIAHVQAPDGQKLDVLFPDQAIRHAQDRIKSAYPRGIPSELDKAWQGCLA